MSSELRNAWVATREPQIVWVAELPPSGEDRLLGWLRTLLVAGREQAVHTVHEAPLAGFERGRDGELEAFAVAAPLALFGFAASGIRPTEDGRRLRVSARLAYAEDGAVVEDEVDDMGALLERLRDEDPLEAGSFMNRMPPLHVRAQPVPGRPLRVTISTHTDIWLPRVKGMLEDDYELGGPYDNRALAERHTPRLNAFLTTVRDATAKIGGSWRIADDFTRADRSLLDDDGLIRLDV